MNSVTIMADIRVMRGTPRAAVLFTIGNKLAVIQREFEGRKWLTLPGGHIEPGEAPTRAAKREVLEEVGVHVEIEGLIARLQYRSQWQFFYLGQMMGGEFGTGQYPEFIEGRGQYTPALLDLTDLPTAALQPEGVRDLLAFAASDDQPHEAFQRLANQLLAAPAELVEDPQ